MGASTCTRNGTGGTDIWLQSVSKVTLCFLFCHKHTVHLNTAS